MNASFPRAARLTQSTDFNYVFAAPERKSSDPCFTVLGRFRLKNQDQPSRLGLVIAKKQIKRAHERNRIKRLIREYFRQHFRQFPEDRSPIDVVIIARQKAQTLENKEIFQILSRHFQKITL